MQQLAENRYVVDVPVADRALLFCSNVLLWKAISSPRRALFGVTSPVFLVAASDLWKKDGVLAEISRVPERVFALGLEVRRKTKYVQKRKGSQVS